MLLTQNAIEYTLRQLVQIALPHTSIKQIEVVDKNMVSMIVFEDKKIIFTLLNDKCRSQLLAKVLTPQLYSFDGHLSLPVFFNEERLPLFEIRESENLLFHGDLITLSFILLSQYEDMRESVRDQHDRCQFADSLSEHYGFINIPIVDYYALMIRNAMVELIPTLRITSRSPQMIVTHDIDELFRFSSIGKTIRSILGGDLLKRRSLTMFKQSCNQLSKTIRSRQNDPYIEGLKLLIDKTQIAGFREIVFMKAIKKGEFDATYCVTHPAVTALIKWLKNRNITIGLHAGYTSYDDVSRFLREKDRIERILGEQVTDSRQHFLRFNREKTVAVWAQAGITDDYTLGYAEREGFRVGTCHPFPIFDIENDQETNILEHPIIAMDGTFFQYQQCSPEEMLQKVQKLLATTQQVEGDFVLLWHNTIVYREYAPYFLKVFCEMINAKESFLS